MQRQLLALWLPLVLGLLAACAVPPRGPANRPDIPPAPQADPRLVAALEGASNDGPAQLDLTREVATANGYRPLDPAQSRAAAAGRVWRTQWRSGRIEETQDHRPSGVRLDRLDFQAGFANGVATAWYIDENGHYCETDASRRNCGPLYGADDGLSVIWFNRSEPSGPHGTLYTSGPGPAIQQGPTGPLGPAPGAIVTLDAGPDSVQQVGRGDALIYRMVTRDEPGDLSAAFEVPGPVGGERCVALRHPSREGELICPSGLHARTPTVGSGWPDALGVLSLEADGGVIVSLEIVAPTTGVAVAQ